MLRIEGEVHWHSCVKANGKTAFVHVDMDNVWAIADCYGFNVAEQYANLVYEDGLPRFQKLFEQCGVCATFFVLGKDVELAANAARLRELVRTGHKLANHSYSHRLDFRNLTRAEIDDEVARAEDLIFSAAGEKPMGFRAPGYGGSTELLQVLAEKRYLYDSSISPHPFGAVFRYMDRRLRTQAGAAASSNKTQYSTWRDALTGLSPRRITIGAHTITEIPAATSPLRLPFQAGVCMRVGKWYFRAQMNAFRAFPRLPLLMLFHGADLTDFSRVTAPLFRSSFFSAPVEQRMAVARDFLVDIGRSYTIRTTEEWLTPSP